MPGTYISPTLTTTLDRTNFRNELDANFTLIQTALDELQTEIGSATVTAPSSYDIITSILGATGIIGVESFVPGFDTDYTTFSISHNTPRGKSSCVISSLYHDTDTAFSATFASIGITGDGDYVVKFGVKTRGAPLIEQMLELEDTDNEQTLTIWKMDVNRNVNLFTVTNLRLMTNVIIDNDVSDKFWVKEHPLTYQYQGVLPITSGRLGTGILVPWDCEVMRAFVRLETPPAQHTDQNTVDIQLSTGLVTDTINVLASAAQFTDREALGAIKTIEAQSEPYQLMAGEYVYPEILTAEMDLTDYPAQAANLSITLLVREIYHAVMR
jgi:hypothetical protein